MNGRLSPHYFLFPQQKYQQSHSDQVETIRRAHRAVRYLADLDRDHAQIANAAGFSKSDSKCGHNLARWPEEKVVLHFALAALALKLARKYRRQLPAALLVDPPEQRALDI